MMDESFKKIVEKRHKEREEAFNRIYEKYDRKHPIDDVLDLRTMTIVENRGHLQNMKAVRFGAKLASSTDIEQYIEELEEEKKRDSLSVVSRSYSQMGKKSSLSWDEADMQDNEASDLLCEILPKGQKSTRQVFKNMLESFQSCAENIIGELFDAKRQNPETFGGCMEMSFGKKKCSWKNSLFYGNRQWDITLQVSASDKVPSRDDLYASPRVEPIVRNVFSTDMNKSFLMNLLQLMRMPSHISLIHSKPLKSKSKSPMCHILTVKSNDCVEKEMCCFKNVHAKNLKAINYSPVKSTPVRLDASIPLSTNVAIHLEEKQCSNQKRHSKNLKAINYSPVKSTPVHLDTSIPLSTNGAIYPEEKLCSNQKLHSKNLKTINYSPVKSTLHHLNASTSLGMNDASYAKEKFCSNRKSHSKNLKAINYTPVKSSIDLLDTSIRLSTNDAIYPEEKLCSNQKCHSKNLKAINYSPVKSTLHHLNESSSLDVNDVSYAKGKFCSNRKSHSKNPKAIYYTPVKSTSISFNASTPLGANDTSYAREKLHSYQKCHSKNLKAINHSPVKSISTHPNIATPLGKNDASYAKEKLCSNQKFDLKNLKPINFSPVSSISVHLKTPTPSRKRCFVADDELSILKTKKVCNEKESNAEKSNTNITGRKSAVGPCSTPSVKKSNQVPLCDLLITPDMLLPPSKSLKITAAKTPKEQKSNVKNFKTISICMLENNP